jgi:hypothetical protein
MFATRLNKRLPLYYSPLLDDEALGVDSLSASWEGLDTYAFLPTPLILAVLNKAASCRVKLCLIGPCWPNQAWFPVLLELLTDHPRRLLDWTSDREGLPRDPDFFNFTLGDYWVFSEEVI